MSPPSTHTGCLLEERTEAPEGAHLGHTDGAGLFAEGRGHFGRGQAADDPQLEQLALVGVEAGERGAHLGLLLGVEDDLGGAGLFDVGTEQAGGQRPVGLSLDIDHDVAADAEEPGGEPFVRADVGVDLGDGSGHGLAHGVTGQVRVSEATMGKGDQAGIHARVERGPRLLIALAGPLDEVSRPLPLVHVTLPLRRMGWKCHISATFLWRDTNPTKEVFAPEAPTPLWRVALSVQADDSLTTCYAVTSRTIFPLTDRSTRAVKASLTRPSGRTSATTTLRRPSARAARAAAFPAAMRSADSIEPP